jgi:hypothetical protein
MHGLPSPQLTLLRHCHLLNSPKLLYTTAGDRSTPSSLDPCRLHLQRPLACHYSTTPPSATVYLMATSLRSLEHSHSVQEGVIFLGPKSAQGNDQQCHRPLVAPSLFRVTPSLIRMRAPGQPRPLPPAQCHKLGGLQISWNLTRSQVYL